MSNSKAGKCKKISKNHFQLVGRAELYIKGEVNVNFTPFRKNKKVPHRSILPTFNKDHLYYTFAFKLPSAIDELPSVLQADHLKRAEEAEGEITDIMVAKPRSKHKYCGVCRSHYQEYQEHLLGDSHKEFLKKSTFQGFIRKLCEQFQQKQQSACACACQQMQIKLAQSDSTDFLSLADKKKEDIMLNQFNQWL